MLKLSEGASTQPLTGGAVEQLGDNLSTMQRQALAAALSSQQWQQLEHLQARLVGAMDNPDGRFMQNMARALGLDFEFLVRNDQLEQANLGLKGVVNSLQENSELASTVREQSGMVAQQLESLQLCRLRLAQDGVLFMPLPFDFLKQGYVLFEERSRRGDDSSAGSDELNYLVSLNLNMEQLGNLQVNLLFEQQKLFVRIKCSDEQACAVVQHHCDELRQALRGFYVGSLQVTTGAEDPALELIRRLQPPEGGDRVSLFDARI
ncbi:MAG: hypothetical protein B6I36_03305 [Desulfobacteraceae bacterium 4572_35.1]|nr:MAG: hypothetical protein B6I36_03305 [Desulfobacteraceae bacterium 4572_35.1]